MTKTPYSLVENQSLLVIGVVVGVAVLATAVFVPQVFVVPALGLVGFAATGPVTGKNICHTPLLHFHILLSVCRLVCDLHPIFDRERRCR